MATLDIGVTLKRPTHHPYDIKTLHGILKLLMEEPRTTVPIARSRGLVQCLQYVVTVFPFYSFT